MIQVLLNGLVLSIQVLILASALYLMYAVSKIFHIALTGILLACVYTFYFFSKTGHTIITALLFSLLIAVLMGLFNYYLLNPYSRNKMYLTGLLVSIIFWIAMETLISIIFGSGGHFLIKGVLPTINFNGLYITYIGFFTILLGIIITITAYIFLKHLPVGRSIRAIKQHNMCASMIGIKEKNLQITIYVISAILVGIIGILTGMNNAITPKMGTPIIILAFISLLVGGTSDFKGVIIATLIFVLLPEFILQGDISSSWKIFIVFIIAVIFLLFKPNGLFVTNIRKI